VNIIKCALQAGGIGIWKCWFLWREENQRTRRKTSEQGRNRATLMGGERSHHCAIPAPTGTIRFCQNSPEPLKQDLLFSSLWHFNIAVMFKSIPCCIYEYFLICTRWLPCHNRCFFFGGGMWGLLAFISHPKWQISLLRAADKRL